MGLRVKLDRPGYFDHVRNWRSFPWYATWIERPRLLASAVAVSLAEPQTACDPACGDGTVLLAAHKLSPLEKVTFGDISRDTLKHLLPKEFPFPVDIVCQDALKTIGDLERVDCIVLTEILEHLEDPDELLRLAHEKAEWLVASSPIVPDGNDHTDQHLWAFDMDGYREMLEGAGWNPRTWFTANAKAHPYESGFQVWGCSRD